MQEFLPIMSNSQSRHSPLGGQTKVENNKQLKKKLLYVWCKKFSPDNIPMLQLHAAQVQKYFDQNRSRGYWKKKLNKFLLT
jgi:hypothetical protein